MVLQDQGQSVFRNDRRNTDQVGPMGNHEQIVSLHILLLLELVKYSLRNTLLESRRGFSSAKVAVRT